MCAVTPRTTYVHVQALCAAAARIRGQGVTAPGKGKKKTNPIACTEAVTLPTHPVGKCAGFEVKPSAACCLMYSGLWCVCAKLRGWVGWRGEFPLFQISANKRANPRTNGSIISTGKYLRSPWAAGGYSTDTSRMPCPSKDCRHGKLNAHAASSHVP